MPLIGGFQEKKTNQSSLGILFTGRLLYLKLNPSPDARNYKNVIKINTLNYLRILKAHMRVKMIERYTKMITHFLVLSDFNLYSSKNMRDYYLKA